MKKKIITSRLQKVINLFTWRRLTWLQLELLIFHFTYISKKQLKQIVISQTVKGFKKYGKTIIEVGGLDYDMVDMAVQELVDMQLYLLKNKNKI